MGRTLSWRCGLLGSLRGLLVDPEYYSETFRRTDGGPKLFLIGVLRSPVTLILLQVQIVSSRDMYAFLSFDDLDKTRLCKRDTNLVDDVLDYITTCDLLGLDAIQVELWLTK